MAKEKIVKRIIKDSVFTDLFGNTARLLELYHALHPEDNDATEDDISIVTIENILVDGIYNDLGFSIKDRLIILIESQSTWSMNILIRSLNYLSKTYAEYFEMKKYDIYSSTKIDIPKPELFVVYTGNRKDRPKEITLSKEFFNGEECALEIKVKMLYGEGNDILCQYVAFTKIFDEKRKLYGYTKKAIIETINTCKDKDILKRYLEGREKEVTDIMDLLYDNETVSRLHDAQLVREAKKEGIKEGEITGRNTIIIDALKNGRTPTQIADFLGIPINSVLEVQNSMLSEAK